VEGRRRMADGVWMIRREEGHADHKGEIYGRHMAAGEQWLEGDTMGEGPTSA
jgi:hypothetical protein